MQGAGAEAGDRADRHGSQAWRMRLAGRWSGGGTEDMSGDEFWCVTAPQNTSRKLEANLA